MSSKTSTKTTNKGVKGQGLTIAVIVAVVVLVAVVAGLLMKMQSPDKQIAGGFANLVAADSIGLEGTFTNGSANSVTLTGVTDKKVAEARVQFAPAVKSETALSGAANVIIDDKGVMYLKFEQPEKLVERYMQTMTQAMQGASLAGSPEEHQAMMKNISTGMTAVAKKLEDKWMKLASGTGGVPMDATDSGSLSCFTKFTQKLGEDASARKQLAVAYTKHRFIIIKEKLEKDGNAQGYRVGLDNKVFNEFQSSVAENEAVKQLDGCGGKKLLTLGGLDADNDRTMDIWVDRFSHRIMRVKYTTPGDIEKKVDFKLSYDKPVKVTAPTEVITADELSKLMISSMAPAQN